MNKTSRIYLFTSLMLAHFGVMTSALLFLRKEVKKIYYESTKNEIINQTWLNIDTKTSFSLLRERNSKLDLWRSFLQKFLFCTPNLNQNIRKKFTINILEFYVDDLSLNEQSLELLVPNFTKNALIVSILHSSRERRLKCRKSNI